jgi:hypothetical protein
VLSERTSLERGSDADDTMVAPLRFYILGNLMIPGQIQRSEGPE